MRQKRLKIGKPRKSRWLRQQEALKRQKKRLSRKRRKKVDELLATLRENPDLSIGTQLRVIIRILEAQILEDAGKKRR